jgi:hypothetical protein
MPNVKLPKNALEVQKFIEVQEIKNGLVVTKDGGLRAVCACSSINFDLLSQTEQEAVVNRFQEFLNSLDFPMQIIVASRHFQIENYLAQISELEQKQTNELLKIQTNEYINFVRSFVEFANIMNKSFYIIVPFSAVESKTSSLSEKIKSIISTKKPKKEKFETEKLNQYKAQIDQRINLISEGLQALGIKTIPLNDEQLTQLYFESYNIDK